MQESGATAHVVTMDWPLRRPHPLFLRIPVRNLRLWVNCLAFFDRLNRGRFVERPLLRFYAH